MEFLSILTPVIAQADVIEEGVTNWIKWIRIIAFSMTIICFLAGGYAVTKGSEGSEKAKFAFFGGALLSISIALATYFFDNSEQAELPSGLSL